MKRIILLTAMALGAFLVFGNTVQAQDAAKRGGKGGPTVEQQLERMTKQLELTDAQKPKVKAVLEETRKKRQEIIDDTSLAPRDRRTKAMALVEEQDKKLKGILTPDQYAKLQKQREDAKAKAKERAPGEKGKKRSAA